MVRARKAPGLEPPVQARQVARAEMKCLITDIDFYDAQSALDLLAVSRDTVLISATCRHQRPSDEAKHKCHAAQPWNTN